MKKALFLSVVVCLFSIAAQAQSCDPEDLSISGLSHYNKSMEYIEHLDLGTHEKAVEELEALIKTDSLWCDGVYNQLGYLCELLYNGSKNDFNKRQKYFNKAVNYYKVYLGFNPNDRTVIEKVSSLEAQLDIAKNSINNSIKIEMVYVEGMLNDDTTDCIHSFYMGKYEVTQAQWDAVMGINTSYSKGPNLPVENIPISDVNLFIKELNRLTGANYRLPTLDEWEFAANGGINNNNYTYSGGHAPVKVAWSNLNSGNRTHPVGELGPNTLGIYDMSGNVSELCTHNTNVIVKGGHFYTAPISIKEQEQTKAPLYSIGFRLVAPIEEYSGDEKKWDSIVREKNAKMELERKRLLEEAWKEQEKQREIDRAEQERFLKEQEERRRKEDELAKKRAWRNSFHPIIQSDGNWIDVNVGYNLDTKTPIAYATISPDPIYASALVFDSTTAFYSAGASLKIINRFNLRLGLAYSQQNEKFGVDLALAKYWKNFGVSGGALIFPDENVIPHFEINCYGIKAGAIIYDKQIIPTMGLHMDKAKSNWEFNLSSIYGYDFKDKNHLMGLNGFYGPFYVSGMYQTDKNFHVSLGGISTMFDENEVLGIHGALSYSSADKFGLDIGLTISFAEDEVYEGNLSLGALIYKDKVIPTIGLGGAGGFEALGIAGLIAAVIWGGYELYMGVNSHL